MEQEFYNLIYRTPSFGFNLQLFADDADKTEDATQKHLDDARKEGQVAKSQELVTSFMLFALFVILRVFVGFMGNNFLKSFYETYPTLGVYTTEIPTIGFFTSLCRQTMVRILIAVAPVLIASVIMAFGLNVAQVKWKPTAKPLQPKLEKISPLKGAKRMFSMSKLFDFVKAIVKLVLIFIVAYNSIKDEADYLLILYDLGLVPAVIYIGNFIINMGMKIAAVYLLIGFADFLYQKFKFKKDMKMSKQEVKDEYKQQEGDPQVKGRIKSKMREASQRRMMAAVPEADVVITNPTHFACAIRYDRETMKAPVLVAKGADYLAQKIKDTARETNVPIVENKALARMLYYNVDLDSEIPEDLYQMTADVLAYVYGLKAS